LFQDKIKRCPHPGVPINGRLISASNFSIGGAVEFECDSGYLMIGDEKQTCLYALQWSDGGAPQCLGKLLIEMLGKRKLTGFWLQFEMFFFNDLRNSTMHL